MVLDTVVDRTLLAVHLIKLKGMTAERVANLLQPDDPQNVPRAVELLRHIIALRDVDTIEYTPSEFKEHIAMSLLGDIFDMWLTPFVDLTMDLSEQLRRLSTYLHLTFYLYRKHRTAFMTSQLYNDSHHCIKNIIFCVAKQQELDPSAPFFIIQVGTDRLEVAFADVRTQDHARNFDVVTLGRKFSVATLLHSLMIKHPELDRGHRRLKYFANEGSDHVNPASVTGNVTAGSVSLQWEWAAGRDAAVAILQRHGLTDAASLFATPNLDLFCPIEEGKIVGVSDSDPQDRSEPQDIIVAAADIELSSNGTADSQEDDSTTLEIDLEDILTTSAHGRTLDTTTHLNTQTDNYLEVVIDHTGQRQSFNKASIVRCALTHKYARKSLERQLRAAGVSRDHLHKFSTDMTITREITDPSETKFTTRDLGVTLVRHGGEVHLAVVQATALREDGEWAYQLPMASFGNVEKKITVTVQVLNLVPAAELDLEVTEEDPAWVWTTSFVRTQPSKAPGEDSQAGKAGPASQMTHYTLSIPGWLLLPISPDLVSLTPEKGQALACLGGLGSDDKKPPASTWRFTKKSLLQLTKDLWDNAQAFSETISDVVDEIPTVSERSELPYRDMSGMCHLSVLDSVLIAVLHIGHAPFIVESIPHDVRVNKLDRNTMVACLICGKSLRLHKVRNHVGVHILRKKFGVDEPKLLRQVRNYTSNDCDWD